MDKKLKALEKYCSLFSFPLLFYHPAPIFLAEKKGRIFLECEIRFMLNNLWLMLLQSGHDLPLCFIQRLFLLRCPFQLAIVFFLHAIYKTICPLRQRKG